VVSFDDIQAELPSGTATVTAEERAWIVAARRSAVSERFGY
jgi:hypothetical protein